MKIGDLIFSSFSGDHDHVGIYAGLINGVPTEIHEGSESSNSLGTVKLSPLASMNVKYYGRIIEDDTGNGGIARDNEAYVGVDSKLGELSAKYESNGNPGSISGGGGDIGGSSYGAYQFASAFGVPYDFTLWLKGENDDYYNRLLNAYNSDGNKFKLNFNTEWLAIANENSSLFLQLQHDYTKYAYYDVVVNQIRSDTGVDFNKKVKH